ncbi:hypothetical protein [Nostoc parmelioides]|uniref:Uncharacterized protein n=1 Tax=Nostoc parmelioides FACHB-3921 TaxID=2692909 RepID=A0ABR8BC92_9NOSO|nr:hypothetical protein [Nostoc parmelioides]MBD2251466.1 hypothetical protein [Nostoc parmelioides FACHB-3921]
MWHDSDLYGNYTTVLRFHPADISKDQAETMEVIFSTMPEILSCWWRSLS